MTNKEVNTKRPTEMIVKQRLKTIQGMQATAPVINKRPLLSVVISQLWLNYYAFVSDAGVRWLLI